ncbi:Nuclear pore complex protein [Trichinella spiralis]|uniref:Nuclear pore complex protein n=1 Tax=Trichinella spiralis TaxID=6334 RepID=A0ABR3K1Z0_TRISP
MMIIHKSIVSSSTISSLKKMRSTIVRAKRTVWAKLFPEIDDVEQKINFNVMTISQKYGILFVALGNVVKMFPTSFVHGIVENFEYRMSETYAILESTSISVQNCVTCIQCNCAGNRLAICVDDGGTPAAFIYEIENINSTSKHIARIQISCGHSTGLKDFRWNPNLTECFSVVLNDGTLSVMKTKNNKFRLVGKTTTTDILCSAWEPLGKRLVAGLSNGKFSIYSVTLNQCSTFDPPPNLPASKFSVIDAIWHNNSEVLLVYAAVDDRKQTFLVQATVSNHKPPSISYGPLIDIQPQIFIDSFPNCSRRYFLFYYAEWNVLLYSSTVGCEVVVLIRDVDSQNWTRCVETESDDDYLVFPTNLYKGDFSAVGMVFDLTNEKPTKTGEGDTFPPFPYIHVFSSEAGLISWRIELLNKRDVPFCRGVAAPQGCKLATPTLVKQSDVIVDGQIRDDNKQLSSSNTVHGHNLSLNLNAAAVNSVSSVLDLRDKSSEHISGVKSLSYIKQRTDEKLSTVSKLQIPGNDPLESPDAAVVLNSDDVNSLINILSKKLTISRKHFCEPIQSKISDNLLSVLQSEVEFFQTKWNGEKERLQHLEQWCSNLRLMSVNMQAYLETMVMYLEQERDGNRYCSMQAYPLAPEQEQRMLNLHVMHDRLQAAVDDICQQVADIRQNLNRYEDMNDPQAWSMICKSFSNIHKASELRFKRLRQLKDQLENLPFQEHCSLNTSICSKIEEWKNENSFSQNKQPSVKRDAQRRLKQYVQQFKEPRIIQVDPFLFECSSKGTNDETASLFRQTFSMPQSSSVLPKEKMLFTKPTVRSPVVLKVEDAHPTVEKQQNVTTVQLSNKADLTSIGKQVVGKMPSTPSSTKDENVNFKPEVSKFVTALKHEEPPLLTAEIAPTISVGKSLFETETKSEFKPAEFKFVLPTPVQTSVEETEISETLSTVSFAGAKVSQSSDKANDKDEKKVVNGAAVENEMPNKTVEQAAVEQQQSADETVVDKVPAVAKEENTVDMDSEVAAPPVDIFNGFSFKVNQEPSVGSDFSFCGLGGKPTPEAAARNVFAGNTSFGTAVVSKPSSTVAQPSSLGLFGSATTFTAPSGPSLFGGQAAVCDPGPFSGGSGSESIAQKGFAVFSTSASTASVSPSAPAFGSTGASAFGGPPTFGSAPTFGGSPSFGGAPTFGASSSPSFGSPPAFGSTSPPKFGQGQGLFGSLTSFNQISQPATGFSTFANANSVSFGALASTFGGASQTNPVSNTALQQQQQPQQQQQQQQQSSFTQWREKT